MRNVYSALEKLMIKQGLSEHELKSEFIRINTVSNLLSKENLASNLSYTTAYTIDDILLGNMPDGKELNELVRFYAKQANILRKFIKEERKSHFIMMKFLLILIMYERVWCEKWKGRISASQN